MVKKAMTPCREKADKRERGNREMDDRMDAVDASGIEIEGNPFCAYLMTYLALIAFGRLTDGEREFVH